MHFIRPKVNRDRLYLKVTLIKSQAYEFIANTLNNLRFACKTQKRIWQALSLIIDMHNLKRLFWYGYE